MISPIPNSESTICYDDFFNWQTKKKTVLDQLEACFLFQLLKLRKIHRKNS